MIAYIKIRGDNEHTFGIVKRQFKWWTHSSGVLQCSPNKRSPKHDSMLNVSLGT